MNSNIMISYNVATRKEWLVRVFANLISVFGMIGAMCFILLEKQKKFENAKKIKNKK